jgi:hypothetical protein
LNVYDPARIRSPCQTRMGKGTTHHAAIGPQCLGKSFAIA